MTSIRQWVVFSLFLALCFGGVGAQEYDVRITRPAKEGERWTVTGTGSSTTIAVTRIDGNVVDREEKVNGKIDLAGRIEVLQVDEESRPVRTSLTVERLTYSAAGLTDQALTEGSVLIAEYSGRETTFRLEGGELPSAAKEMLSRWLSLDSPDEPDDDDVFKTGTHRKIGDTWEIDGDLLARTLRSAEIPVESVTGVARLEGIEPFSGLECVRVVADVRADVDITGLASPDAVVEGADLQASFSWLVPTSHRFGAARGSITIRFNLTMRASDDSAGNLRVDMSQVERWDQAALPEGFTLEVAKAEEAAPTIPPSHFNKGFEAYDRGDFAAALREWVPLAERGNAMAQYFLGVMFSAGQGVDADHATAAKWFGEAARQGLPAAQHLLGECYLAGLGVDQNDAEAVTWLRAAADHQDADAQLTLAKLYIDGRGVARDLVQAFVWSSLAAIGGNEEAPPVVESLERAMSKEQIEEATDLLAKRGSRAPASGEALEQGLDDRRLFDAAYQGDNARVRTLLAEGSNTEQANPDGWTPVMIAAAEGHAETVEILLAHGANPDARNRKGRTPLMFAALYGYTSIAGMLIDAGANRDGGSADEERKPPLIAAASRGHVETLSLLLDRGATLGVTDGKGRCALVAAAEGGHVRAVRVLLAKGADPNQSGESGYDALFAATLSRNTTLIGLLIEAGAEPDRKNEYGNTPLLLAISEGYSDAAVVLLDGGASPEIPGTGGFTPLMTAALRGDMAVARALLKRGVRLDTQSDGGFTALRIAKREGHKELVKLLRAADKAN